jgi:hypothetical protein
VGGTSIGVTDVDEVWRDQRRWSHTANRLKKSIAFWRSVALVLAIGAPCWRHWLLRLEPTQLRGCAQALFPQPLWRWCLWSAGHG